jgi:hypothetical protein
MRIDGEQKLRKIGSVLNSVLSPLLLSEISGISLIGQENPTNTGRLVI